MFPNAKAGCNILKTLGIWGHTLILVEWTYPKPLAGGLAEDVTIARDARRPSSSHENHTYQYRDSQLA